MKVKKEIVEFKRDEYPKENVTADSIAKLRGAFPVGPESPNPVVVNTFEPTGIQDAEDKGTPRVTAANASGINDGAAAIVLASGEAVEKYGLKPMVKLIGWGQGGVDPVSYTHLLLQRQIGVVPFRECVPLSVRQRAAVCRRPGPHGSIQGCVRQRIGLYQILQCATLRERSGCLLYTSRCV